MRPPENILLATNLGSHSDRALDRAAQLARQWRATLHVVHAMRPDRVDVLWPSAAQAWRLSEADVPPVGNDEIEAVRRQIEHDLREPVEDLVVHVVAGKPADVILETAARENCDLVIMGFGAPPFAGIHHFNTTSTELLESSPQSVLIVKSRPHGPYGQVLVGTDFTSEARHGLRTAIDWFPGADFALVHALDIPFKSLLLESNRGEAFANLEHETMEAFIDGMQLPTTIRKRVCTHIMHGPPERMLRGYSNANDVDLTVVGALKRGFAFRMFVGGSAARIAQTMPGDILMVRATPNTHQTEVKEQPDRT